MFCDNCGKELKENARFCPKCGQKVIALSDLESGLDSAEDIVIGNHNSLGNSATGNSKSINSRSRKKGLIVTSCALIVIALVGLAVYFSSPVVRAARQMKLGNKYLQKLNYEQAVAALTKALEIDPDDEGIKKLLAEAYIGWGEELVESGDIYTALAKIDEARSILGDRSEFDSLEDEIQKKRAEVSGQTPIQTEEKKEEDNVLSGLSNVFDSGSSAFSNLEKGQYVTFGSYEQDNDLSNGKEPIEWEVLRVEEDKALLISRYVLYQLPYNNELKELSWEKCSLRRWLNSSFYVEAFTDNEKKNIQSTFLENSDNPKGETDGGNDTEDNIFCLSWNEVLDNYNFNNWDNQKGCGYCQDLVIDATPYAKANHVYTYTLTDDECNSIGYPNNMIGKNGSYWWLRSPGSNSYVAGFIGCNGLVDYESPPYDTGSYTFGVRPALWVSVTGSSSKDSIKEKQAVTENLEKLALDYYERHNNYRPSYCDVEDNGDGTYTLHLYDIGIDMTSTCAWYLVDENGIGEDSIFGDKVDLKH